MQIDLDDKDAWDDTELIDAYERAVATYRGANERTAPHAPHGARSHVERREEREEQPALQPVRAVGDTG
eukprot:CAMPEP_0119379006 /NCGR_PEP_ID=MMETSP1334-20130426/50969_1 /TAXON_ID=127549 /ORGANISM="Calcidiscus leptoporus, Strain RCC1130" /LENGTH=68 /DNA_ID=CAMNT_0007398391 /DNA_START=146 /DNA_END=348 /DNA_ORIENTATION=+